MSDTEWKVVEKAATKTESMVGIEVEGLLLNTKGEAIVPPAHWDRDGFPLLLEIRGEPGKTAAETYANFMRRKLEVEAKPKSENKIAYETIHLVRLKTYKEAMKQVTEPKGAQIGKVKNIQGINVEDYSDKVIKGGKIQGIHASCGLHIHFSCGQTAEMKVEVPEYEHISIPIETIPIEAILPAGEIKGAQHIMKHLMKTSLCLYQFKGYKTKEHLTASVTQLNRPTIEWMVKKLDDELFKKFAPPKEQRTKFRQAGFYELKPHGFEYRSLPANNETLAALPEIIDFAYKLLEDIVKKESNL